MTEELVNVGRQGQNLFPAMREAFEISDDTPYLDMLIKSACRYVDDVIQHPDFSSLDTMAACAFRIIRKYPNLRDLRTSLNSQLSTFIFHNFCLSCGFVKPHMLSIPTAFDTPKDAKVIKSCQSCGKASPKVLI